MFNSPLTTAALFALSATRVALASPCVAFDTKWNLLAFGLNGKDWNAGTQDKWTSSTAASDITATGRPPFDGSNTTCYLSEYTNSIYVMNGDASAASSVHIYDASASSWSTQSVTAGTFDPSSFKAILDHDTNVFYALSKGELFFLDMAQLKAANSTPLAWTDVGKAGIDTTGYDPVMALAQNHIHFLDVPGLSAGQADIFVIHFSYWQPEAQSYPATSGSDFPQQHGQVASFFQSSGQVQQEFAYIPDDGSATYVINVENNSTTPLAAPVTKDAKATYAAGITALVQLDSTGAVSFLPYTQGEASTNSAASWAKVAAIAAAAPAGSSSSASAGASATASGSSTKTGKASATGSGTGSASAGAATQTTSSAAGRGVATGLVLAVVLAVAGFMA